MAKLKSMFFCQSCGAQSSKWLGKCPSCSSWNSYVEEVVSKEKTAGSITKKQKVIPKPILLEQVVDDEENRISLNDGELNRVLGGGLVPGSLILLGGEPGIGKSTLSLQIALKYKGKVLYVSGEESEKQIKMRASRLSSESNNCFVLAETSMQNIFLQVEQLAPDLIVLDSIQTMHTAMIESSPGSVSQIRECAGEIMRFAKTTATPVFIIGHITKDGMLAGPKILEHMVDTVLQFEGDRHHIYRILRASKNRFGSTNELGIYEMSTAGLIEVKNPSEVLISNREEVFSGMAIGCTMEGIRAMLIETQALVSSAAYGTAQRSSTGYDLPRLNMLLAVLEKKCGLRYGNKDVFLNITGGIRVVDPSVDLAIVCAILSSDIDIALGSNICFAGEIGLSGEIRPVNRVDIRIMEAQKLGYEAMVISKYNKGISQENFNIEIIKVSKIEEVFRKLFKN